jgi:hypothetical protein
MSLSDDFGLKQFGSFDAATGWAQKLSTAVNKWAPRFEVEEEEDLPLWIGTGVASAGNPEKANDNAWMAVAIVESRVVLEDRRFQECWGHIHEGRVPFAVLEVGPVDVAANAVFGGSIGVVGIYGGGTLGGAVTAGQDCIALTAGHVLSGGDTGAYIEQPAASHGYPCSEIGRVIGWSAVHRRHNRADLGLIALHPDCDRGERTTLIELKSDDLGGLRVHKTGKTTATTSGQVTRVNAENIGIRYKGRRKFFDGIFAIEQPLGRFAWFGDSGALVLEDGGGAVGMVIAVSATGGTDDQPLTWAVATSPTLATMAELLS